MNNETERTIKKHLIVESATAVGLSGVDALVIRHIGGFLK